MAMRPQTIAAAARQRNPLRADYEDFNPVSEWKVDEQGSDILLIHLPGFVREQLRVVYEDAGLLRVNGQRLLGKDRWGRFNQEYLIPENCDVNKIRAKFQNATLTVTLPKKPVAERVSKEPESRATIPPPPPPPPPKLPPTSTAKQTTTGTQHAQPASPLSSPEHSQPTTQKPTSSIQEQQLAPPQSLEKQSQPRTPKPAISLSPPMQPLPGIPKATTENELIHQKGPDETTKKENSLPSKPQPSLGKPTLPTPTLIKKLRVPKPTSDDETSEDDPERTSEKKQAAEDNKGAMEDETPSKIKDQKKTGTENKTMTVPRKVSAGQEDVMKKNKKGAENSKVLDKDQDKAHSDVKEDKKNKTLAGRTETDGLEFSNYVKHMKSGTSEARQELLNMGVAFLVIFALGTYIYNTVGPSQKN